jgi:hypothetical protein
MLCREIIGVGPENHKNTCTHRRDKMQFMKVTCYMVLFGFKQLLSVQTVSLMLAVYCLSNNTTLDHVHCNCSVSD